MGKKRRSVKENWKVKIPKLPELRTETIWFDFHYLSEKVDVTYYDVPRKKKFKDT